MLTEIPSRSPGLPEGSLPTQRLDHRALQLDHPPIQRARLHSEGPMG